MYLWLREAVDDLSTCHELSEYNLSTQMSCDVLQFGLLSLELYISWINVIYLSVLLRIEFFLGFAQVDSY